MSGRGVMTSRTSVSAKIDDRLQERPFLALDEVGLFACLSAWRTSPPVFFRTVRDNRTVAFPPAVDGQPDERAGQRMQESGGEIERRQEQLEHFLWVARRTMRSGSTCSKTRMNTATNNSSIPIDEKPSDPVSSASTTVASEKISPSISRAGTKSWMGSSR